MRALAAGEPRLVVIEGPAGIGKTSLMTVLRAGAARAGRRVMTARGSELERDFAFGVVGQLLEPIVFASDQDESARWFAGAAALARPLFEAEPPVHATVEEELRFRRRHGLFWLIANMARGGPLAVVIDDAQWADEPSAGFVRHLVTRLEQLPILLAVASRPGEGALSGLVVEPGAQVLRPGELSPGAVRDWVSQSLDQEADEEFSAACHRITGGNPFMVNELIREMRRDDMQPMAEAVRGLRSLSPQGVATSVLLRLAGLPAAASALARAVAVLGETDLRTAASLAGLESEVAAGAASELMRAGVLAASEHPSFVHPLVRTVLYEDIPPAERLLAHAQAARVLHDADARAEQVAAQLVLGLRVGESWASEALLAAAAGAAVRGAPEVAARFLERVLVECGAEQRFEVLLALGRVEALAGRPVAMARLRAATEVAGTPVQRARAAITLGRMLRYAGAGGEAVMLLEAAAAGLTEADRELSARVEQELLATSTVSFDARRRLTIRARRWRQPAERPPRSFFDRFLSAAQAVEAVSEGREVSEVVELAETAVDQDPGAGHLGRHVRMLALYAFLLCDRFDRVQAQLDSLAEIAAARGGAEMRATVAATRALVARRRGHLLDAEAEALSALESVADLGESPPSFLLTASAALIWVAIERGDAPHPLAVRSHDDGDSLFGRHLKYARAVLQIAERRFAPGSRALLAVGERELGIGWGGPSQFAWRSDAALALQAIGEGRQARRLAQEELRLARVCGAPRALGVALRASALLGDDDPRLRLREAVSVLEHSGADLEYARALVDLGGALRRAGQPTQARAPLQRGYALATSCGATLLAKRAREELTAAGGRPRRAALQGRAALTPSEARVVELAAQSLSNRDIAQALYVTEKTVEAHLGHAYTKLGVSSRRDLPAALAAER